MFDSIDHLVDAIHAFFHHAQAAADLHSAASDHIASLTDLHHGIFDAATGLHQGSILPGDFARVLDTLQEHGVAVPAHIAESVPNIGETHEAARQAAAQALGILHQPLFGGYGGYESKTAYDQAWQKFWDTLPSVHPNGTQS
jgi:hypothetical protein